MASLRVRPRCSVTTAAADCNCERALLHKSSTRLLATPRVSVAGSRRKAGHERIRSPLVRVSAGLGSTASPGDANAAAAAPVETPQRQQFYEWKPGKRVAYRVVPSSSPGGGKSEPPILLLTGFGVGNFHYDRLLRQLEGISSDVYLLDWFGQGDSWPTVDPCPSPDASSSQAGFEHGFGPGPAAEEFEGFNFSADMWTEQAVYFLEEVVGRPAVLCGNSLGGFIAANLVAQRPDLAEGLVLLNATPFWGLTSTGIWDGVYPLPKLYRSLGVAWWNWIRDPSTIRSMLDFVYAKPMTEGGYHEALVDSILAPTQQRAAASVFCSILSSPPPTRTFNEMIDVVREGEIPCILAYGRDDPWIVPLWGLRAHRRLTPATNVQGGSGDERQQDLAPSDNCRYYEMTPAGHCPQDEAPEAVALLIRSFMHSLMQQEDEGCCGRLGGMLSAAEFNEQLRGRTDVEIRLYPRPEPRTPVEALDAAVFAVQQRMRASTN